MGIFTRLRDIVSSNINAMLDKAEDPEKMLRLMIQEMEDTLVEIKAQCAASMAQSKNNERRAEEIASRAADWEEKAGVALEKGREDLAREALMEKRRYQEMADSVLKQKTEAEALVDQYQNDIDELEEKIRTVREKQKSLIQRHQQATTHRTAQESIRRADTSDILNRFENFERRVDQMEAEAGMVNYGRKKTLDEEFAELDTDEEVEAEMEELRRKVSGGESTDSSKPTETGK